MMATEIHDGVLASEAGRILGVSPQTIRTWEHRGHLRAVRVGHGVRVFERRELVELAERRAAEARNAR